MADNQKDSAMADTVVVGEGEADVAASEAAEKKKLTSLLEYHLEEDLPSFSRIMLLGKLGDSDEDAAVKSLREEFKRLAKDFRIPVTGVGIVQDDIFVCVLECFPDDLCTLVRRVSSVGRLSGLKVIANSEDCPSQKFMPMSFHRVVNSKEGTIDLDAEFGDAATAGFSVYEKLLRLGAFMRKSNKAVIPSSENTNVPSCSRCLAYLAHEGFFTAPEYLEIFDDPAHVVPVTDLLWPNLEGVPLS